MFNKYWREYPMWLQALLLFLMVFTMLSASYVLGAVLVPTITGVPLDELVNITKESPRNAVNAFLLFQMLTNLFSFAGAAFLFTYASHPDKAWYLGFRKIKKPLLLVYALVIAFAALPLVLQVAHWLQGFDLGAGARDAQERTEEIMEAILSTHSILGLLFTLLVLAVVPAVSEELFFRGVMMRFLHKRTQNITFAILTSAGIFALFHSSQPYNIPSILAMGIILGYLYYFTGSIWVTIIVHFVHNGFQVILSFVAHNGVIAEGMESEDSFEWYVLLVAAVILVAFFYLLKKQATPLPAGWSDDFNELDKAAEDIQEIE